MRLVISRNSGILFLMLSGFVDVQAFSLKKQGSSLSPLSSRNKCSSSILFSSTTDEMVVEDGPKVQSMDDDAGKDDTLYPCVIVGGGPAGLLSAIMYAKTFPEQKNIQVFDRLSPPPNPTDDAVWSDVTKFYLIGLGGRGQKALTKFGVWDEVKNVCTAVLGRKDWAPDAAADEGVERIFTDRPYTTEVLPRDKLVGVLHKHILENFTTNGRITLNYGYEVTPEDFGSVNSDKPVQLRISKCEDNSAQGVRGNPISTKIISSDEEDVTCDVDNSFVVNANLLIAADGTGRTVANQMEANDKLELKSMNPVKRLFASRKKFQVVRYEDDNQRIYKTIPLKLPDDWRHDLNYSARTNRFNIDALPADGNGNYCGVLLLKKEDSLAAGNTDPKELRSFFEESLSQFGDLIDDKQMEAIAKKEPSYLPSFRYAGPRLHQGYRTVILGDCAHTVKPYFGLGANSALEDVSVLSDILSEHGDNTGAAVKEFSKRRAKESKVLVKISRDLDRPGKLGVFTFLVPLIMDSIFNKMAPKVFAPNIISMLQRDGVGFVGVQRRKRMDRAGQVIILSSLFTSLTLAARFSIAKLALLTGKAKTTVVAGLALSSLLAVTLRKALFLLNPNIAPADVMPKSK